MRPVRIALAIGAIAGATGLCAMAWDNARADLLMAHASNEMATWTSREVVGEAWDWVRDDLDRAAVLDPGDPAIQELLGLLKSRRHDRADLVGQAVLHFERALELRPVSPYAWAHLAQTLYRLGVTEREFEAALRRAAGMGPSEPQVQRMVADMGLAVWNETSAETRQAVERMVAAGLRRNPPEMLRILERRGRLDVACRRWLDDADLDAKSRQERCESREKTP